MQPSPPSSEPDRPDSTPPVSDWRSLVRLRDRVEMAAQEIERLRAENDALARRVRELHAMAGASGEGLADLPAEGRPAEGSAAILLGADPAELRARVEAFIAALDEVIRLNAPAPAAPPPPHA